MRMTCDICGGSDRVKVLGKWLLGVQAALCFPCFCEWYDGETDTEIIREKSLAKQATKAINGID